MWAKPRENRRMGNAHRGTDLSAAVTVTPDGLHSRRWEGKAEGWPDHYLTFYSKAEARWQSIYGKFGSGLNYREGGLRGAVSVTDLKVMF